MIKKTTVLNTAAKIQMRVAECMTGVLLLSVPLWGAPQDKPYRLPSEYLTERYEMLDSWQETLGLGTDATTVARYKLHDVLGDKAVVVTVDANGSLVTANKLTEQALIEPEGRDEEPVVNPPSKLHPRLLDRFQEGGVGPGVAVMAETQETVHVWLVDTAAQEAMGTKAAVRSHFDAIIEDFIRQEGISDQQVLDRYHYAPAIALRLTLAECMALETSPLVNFLFPEDQFDPELDKIASATRAKSVWQKGYTGSGAVIADIEAGRIAPSMYLVATPYQPEGMVNDHATAIGGIIRSTSSTYRGIAYGCTLLSANAATNTFLSIKGATEWAIDNGASVLNMSFGYVESVGSPNLLNWADIYLDYVSYYSHVLVVKSAGNDGATTGRVTSPGRGYNSLTVGNVNGKRTSSWADDVMSPSSSWDNPVSGTDKPEIVAQGTDIYSTTTSSPWLGSVGSGTSYAAPVVAGIAGLVIGKMPSYATVPEVVKAKILVSGLAHNIEGAATLSDKDGAGVALATAVDTGSVAVEIRESQFDENGYYEVPADIPLRANDTKRIVLVYMYPPSSINAAADPSSYWKSDLDLSLNIVGGQVASSTYGTRNPFEIIDYTPAATGTGRLKIRKVAWNERVSSIRCGIAWASLSTLGTAADN